MPSYVVYFKGLIESNTNAFKIIRATSPEQAAMLLRARLKNGRVVVAVEEFISYASIPKIAAAREQREKEYATLRAKMRTDVERWLEEQKKWPLGYVPDSPNRYLIAVLLTAAI